MKKEHLYLLIGLFVMVVLSVGMILVQTNLLPTSNVDRLFGQKVVIKNETRVTSNDTILSQADVYSLGGDNLGTLYVAVFENTFVYTELYVAITPNGVYAIDKVMEAKDSTSESKLAVTRAFLIENFSGISTTRVSDVDTVAGTTVSTEAVIQVIQEVVNFHNGVVPEVDYIKDLFGGQEYVVVSETEESGIQIKEVTVNSVNYRVFIHSKEGTYETYDGNIGTGSITLYIATNEDGLITHGLLPDSLYGHTGGNYRTYVQNYLANQVVGVVNINDPMPDSDGSTAPTARHSLALLIAIIDEIREVA